MNINFFNNKLSNAKTLINYFPIVIKEAKYNKVIDINNKSYIDCILSAGSLPLGHNHPIINESINYFTKNNFPVQTMDIPTELQYNFMKTLYNFIPDEFNDYNIQFCSPSGSDAIDAAIKLCKISTNRNSIISFTNGYHGQSYAASSISSKLKSNLKFTPLNDTYILPYPNNYSTLSEENINNYINDILINNFKEKSKPAAVIVEPIQGEGGINIPSINYLRNLRKITKILDIPLILDEVQTGFCRTGYKFGFQHSNIKPDVICMAKAIGGSQPLSCILHNNNLNNWTEYNHSGTWRGNQLSFLTGEKIINYMETNKLWKNAELIGILINKELNNLKSKYNCIGDIRTQGLMIGFEIINNNDDPCSDLTSKFQQLCFKNGLLLLKSGPYGNVIRIVCPININSYQVYEIIDIINKSLNELKN